MHSATITLASPRNGQQCVLPVVVHERHTGYWVACIAAMPALAVSGSTASEAIERLTAVAIATVNALAPLTTRVDPLPVIDVTAE